MAKKHAVLKTRQKQVKPTWQHQESGRRQGAEVSHQSHICDRGVCDTGVYDRDARDRGACDRGV